jgi:hypothetical protein
MKLSAGAQHVIFRLTKSSRFEDHLRRNWYSCGVWPVEVGHAGY